MKRVLFLLFATMLAGQVWAAYTFEVNNFKYTVIDEKNKYVAVTFIGSTKPTGTLYIPGGVEDPKYGTYYYVTKISGGFGGNDELTSVIIPNNIKEIGNSTFLNDVGLTSVTIGSSVEIIGEGAFQNCSSLTTIEIPNSVRTIEAKAFSGCKGLASVNIGNSVKTIGNQVFENCSELINISVDNKNTNYSSVDGVLFNKDKTTLVCYPVGKTGTYTIPNSVTSIGDYAFQYCKLSLVTIPNSVTNIGSFAFDLCRGLTSITIPNSVTSIGADAFYGCAELVSVTIPKSVTNISGYAFAFCSAATIYCEIESIPSGWLSNWCYQTKNYKLGCKKITSNVNNSKYGNIEPNISGGIGENNTLWYAKNEKIELMAAPKVGYHFKNWEDNSTDNPRTITITADMSYTATFEAHTKVTDAAVRPTCTETGLTTGTHCSVCGEVIVAQDVIPANGHTEIVDNAIAPTCTETGLTEGKHCTVCGVVTVAQEVIPASHTEIIDSAVAATCTESGLTEGKHCSVCGEVLVAQAEVPIIAHTIVTDAAVAATATKTGLTEGSHCSVCCVVIVAQEVIPALGEQGDENDGNNNGNQNGGQNGGNGNENQNGVNQNGNEQGYNGNQAETNTGYSNGYKDGYNDGYSNGLVEGSGGTGTINTKMGDADYNDGYSDGYKDGYREGFKVGKVGSTPVSEIAAYAINIYAHGRTIVVENATEEIIVYDAMGRLVCRDVACRVRAELQVNTTGVYIVKVGNVVKRLMVN